MKKAFLIFISIFIYTSCTAQEYSVKENYDTMNFEIVNNDIVIYELAFGNFCGYQQVKNKIFFIDNAKSNIYEYGEVCYFDCNLNKMVYTGIFSGSSFYVTDDLKFLIATTLLESKTESDIGDVFGLGINTKQYPLNISVYDLDNSTKIKDVSFREKLDEEKLENFYVELTPVSKTKIQIDYCIYDSTYKINCGIVSIE